MISKLNKFVWLTGAIIIAQGSGCANSYGRYSQCEVNCQYCEPAPLPYTQYPSCVCHSTAAARYLSGIPAATAPESHPVAVSRPAARSASHRTISDRDENLFGIIKPISQVTLE